MTRLFLIVSIIISFSASAQIVNIESQRMQSDTTGWQGSLGTSFSLIKNVQQILGIDANAHLQYKTKKDLYLILASYDLLRARGTNLANNMFYHVRYNRKLNKWLRWELFTQLQQNTVTGIRFRSLFGTGPRFKIYDSSHLKLYAGTAAMYESENENTEPVIRHRDIRNSSYLSLTWKPNSFITVVSSYFYQPLFHKINDFRFMNETTLSIKATKRLSLNTSFNYLFDAYPAAGTTRENYNISNGFTYAF